MRLLVLVLLSSASLAQDVCLGAACIEQPLRDGLAAAGVTDVDGLAISTDGKSDWLTLTSNDAAALARAFPKARVQRIGDLDAYAVTVPLDVDALGLANHHVPYPDITLKRGGGGGGSTCEEVCVCTETGVECWLEC